MIFKIIPTTAILASLLFVSGCSGAASDYSPESSQAESVAPVESETEVADGGGEEIEESESSSGTYGLGDSITGDGFVITLNGARFTKKGTLNSKPDNDRYLLLDLTVENTTDEDNSLSTLLSFELQGSDDYKYSQALFVDTKGSLDGTVAASGKLRGEIAYDVPILDSYTLFFENSLFDDAVQFKIAKSDIDQ